MTCHLAAALGKTSRNFACFCSSHPFLGSPTTLKYAPGFVPNRDSKSSLRMASLIPCFSPAALGRSSKNFASLLASHPSGSPTTSKYAPVSTPNRDSKCPLSPASMMARCNPAALGRSSKNFACSPWSFHPALPATSKYAPTPSPNRNSKSSANCPAFTAISKVLARGATLTYPSAPPFFS